MYYHVGNGIEITLFYPLENLYRSKTWNLCLMVKICFLLYEKLKTLFRYIHDILAIKMNQFWQSKLCS